VGSFYIIYIYIYINGHFSGELALAGFQFVSVFQKRTSVNKQHIFVSKCHFHNAVNSITALKETEVSVLIRISLGIVVLKCFFARAMIFTTQCYASVVYAMALYPSASVSVGHKSKFCRNA